MYYDDLTKFTYLKILHPNDLPKNLLNIGWLDSEYEFPKGKSGVNILEIIKKITFTARSLHMTRGYQFCQYCNNMDATGKFHIPILVELDGIEKKLGSGVVIIQGNSHAYAFPDLLYHYMSEHDYMPPNFFIEDMDALGALESHQLLALGTHNGKAL